jgi:mRNA-degrading endonuclease RelE of RelBE toxin-antitoxin system
MDHIVKLLRRISQKDREMLRALIISLQSSQKRKALNIVKIQNTDLYRAKKGRFRIIFHIEGKDVVIDSIRIRNERTYK